VPHDNDDDDDDDDETHIVSVAPFKRAVVEFEFAHAGRHCRLPILCDSASLYVEVEISTTLLSPVL